MQPGASTNERLAGKRVALFTQGFGGGGAERVMLTLAEGLAERGVDVDLVAPCAYGPLQVDIPDNVRFIDLGARRIITSLWPLVRYLRRERPTAMITALATINCVAVWARALAHVRMRLILSEHNTLTHDLVGAFSIKHRVMPFFMRWSYPHADVIVAVSAGVADDLAAVLALRRERLKVIYNPVVTPTMLEKSLEPVDHPWFARNEPPVILGAGRLTAQKDFSGLVRAFALVRSTRQARLVILGEGEKRSELEAMVAGFGLSEDVDMPGFVSNPYPYMRRAALFVLSSRWEGLGNVLIEASACGTQVISTDCPSGPAEILASGRYGRMVPIGDYRAMADAMIGGLDSTDRKDYTQMMKDKFSVKEAVDRYLSLLNMESSAGVTAETSDVMSIGQRPRAL